MLLGLLILLVCQLLGELVVMAVGLPIPGPVIGMLILFFGLMAYGEVPDCLRFPAESLLRYLALLFVPAGVGLIQHLELVQQEWLAILLTLVASTAIALLVTGWVFQRLLPRTPPKANHD